MEHKNNDSNKIRHWADALNDLSKGDGKDDWPARVQEVRLFADEVLAIGLYQRGLVWLIFDLNNANPDVYTVDDLSELKRRETKKPLSLFMQAHFRGAKFVRAETRPEFGRVIWLYFDSAGEAAEGALEIEVRLFARGANAIARAGDKSVALRKPSELKVIEHFGDEIGDDSRDEAGARGPADGGAGDGILMARSAAPPTKAAAEDPRQKRIEKLKKALLKVEAELAVKKSELWQAAGEQIKLLQTLDVPIELSKFIDAKKSLTWNIQTCFQKAKAVQKKIVGTETRRRELAAEIAEAIGRLVTEGPDARLHQKNADRNAERGTDKKAPALLNDAEARGRTFDLGDNLYLFVGKSAADNLRILRKAKPWHYWLHLRDHPGSHGIVARNKNQAVDDNVLQKAAHHLLMAQFGSKAQRHSGEKFGVVVTECRFVRPIRGDRLGRVNYSDARTLVHQLKS